MTTEASERRAWVVAVDMGYGHQRAAYPFRDIACERIITANGDEIVTAEEKRLWGRLQGFYEGISRFSRVPLIGPPLWRAYDRLQAISPYYPFRDLSKPTLGSLRLHRMIRRGFAASVVEYTRRREELPLLTTFFAVALAADHAGRKDVFCVVTDTDVNRIWVAEKPAASRIRYLAPMKMNRTRLLHYGVPEENIFVTGFPLPEENVAAAEADFARRIAVLDPKNAFRDKYRALHGTRLEAVPPTAPRPLTVTYAVGGAGAQADVARDILASLAPRLKEGRIRLNLIAGTRLEVSRYFRQTVVALGLEPELGRAVTILCALTKAEYFERFNLMLRETDVLWTKPSELCFYAALGIPLVMAPPLGAHEERNRAWLIKLGAAQDQEDPRAASDWLADWCDHGLLAYNALNGFLLAPRHGTENVKRLLFAPDRTRVQLVV